MKLKVLIPLLALAAATACHTSENNTNPGGMSGADTANMKSGVYFVNLKNGDVVKSPVIVIMGVKGMTVEPAGMVHDGMGHHHLIVDGNYIEKGLMIPKDSTHLHFGKGQTVDTLKLSPGKHTLTLQFADGMHMSYGKDWSATVSITVSQ